MARVTALVASLLVARALGLPSFGKFGMLQSTLLMFQTFAAFGLGETATKYLAELRATDPERAGRIAGLSTTTAMVAGVAFASLLFFLAPVIARRALQAPELEGALRVSAPALFFGALTGAQTGALAGLEAFRAMARVNVIAGLLTLPLLVGGVYLGGLTGGVWGLVLISAGTWLANKLVLHREFERSNVTIRFRGCVRELPVLWGFSLPAVLGGAMVVPVHWLCATLLVQRPGGYAEMGLFNAANQWHQALLFIPTLVSQAVLPILANRLGTGEREQALGTLRSAIRANAIFSASIALVLAALSPWIMQSYGAGFRAGWPTLTIVVLTSVLFAISVPVGQFIAASGKMWVGFAMNSGWALAYFVFSMGLVQFGARGLAGARFLAYCLHAVWTFGYAAALRRRIPGTRLASGAPSET